MFADSSGEDDAVSTVFTDSRGGDGAVSTVSTYRSGGDDTASTDFHIVEVIVIQPRLLVVYHNHVREMEEGS